MNDIISELVKGTQFEIMDENSVGLVGNRPIVETPLDILNAFLGGGIPLGCITEVFGPNAGGKSTIVYMILANFMKAYPKGVSIILDAEATTDTSRLKLLGIDDPSRILRLKVNSLEDGFENINTIIDKVSSNKELKDVPIFILWDTIANNATRAQVNGGTFSGGIAESARVIKHYLKLLTTRVASYNVGVILLNQVISKIGGYTGGYASAGGNGLNHDIHLKFYVDGGSTEYDQGIYATTKHSYLTIKKSKISPIMDKSGIPIVLDITKGGCLDKERSVLEWMCTIGVISQSGGWYYISDDYYERYSKYFDKIPILGKKFRYNALVDESRKDPYIIKLFVLIWTDIVMDKYALQREVCSSYHDNLLLELTTHYEITEDESEVNHDLVDGLADLLETDNNEEDVTNEEVSE